MNDAQHRAIVNDVTERVALWKTRLWLGNWTIHTEFVRGDLGHETAENYTAFMDVNPDWRYMTALIRVNTVALHENLSTPDERDESIIHELLHCVLHELKAAVHVDEAEQYSGHEERVITVLTNAIQFAYTEDEE